MKAQLRERIAAVALAGAALITIAQSQNGVRSIAGDFVARYAAGEVTAADGSPYDDDALRAAFERLGHAEFLPFYDAPPVAAAFRLLAVLPLEVASLLLWAVSLGACVALARRLAPRASAPTLAVASIAVMTFSPARHALMLGQIDIIVLALVLLVAGRQPIAAIAKPQTAGLMAAALYTRSGGWRPRALLEAAVGAAAVLLLSALLAPGATWARWLEHLGERPQGRADLQGLVVAVAVAGALLLIRAAWQARRAARWSQLVPQAGAATALLAAMGGWNPQWFMALLLPLGVLLGQVHRGEVELRRREGALLVLVVAASAGDAYVAYNQFAGYRLWIPVLAVAGLMAGLALLDVVTPAVAGAVVVLNAAVTTISLSQDARVLIPMLVAVALLHLMTVAARCPAPRDPAPRPASLS